jgi:hypothetical protein
VELERGEQTDDAFGNEDGGLGERMARIHGRIGQLVESTSGPHDLVVPHQTRQRLGSDPARHEVFQPEHAAGFQQVEDAGGLGVSRRHRE